ncbi:MAG: hypothetical protein MAG431_00370 [Chloroflexi bacterium]|nr:hypothetical protein [Chloroflexota bacterium]
MNVLPFNEVARRLDQANITWCVFAGAAASVYGSQRILTDVDILVPSAEGDRLAAIFPESEVEREADGTVRGIKLPGIDIIAGLDSMDLDAAMAERLDWYEVAYVVAPVIPPEDNILLKAMWGRGPEVGKHDWEDVEAMLGNIPDLDWDYLRWRAKECGAEHLLEKLESLRP